MTDRAKLEEAIKIAREKAGATHAHWWDITPEFLAMVFAAAEAHLATLPPPTKTVEVWRVEWSQNQSGWKAYSQSEGCGAASKKWADERAEWLIARPDYYTCIRVTGPHQQEVPA